MACVKGHEWLVSLAWAPTKTSAPSGEGPVLFIFVSLTPNTEPASLGECTYASSGTHVLALLCCHFVPEGHVPG